MSRIDSARGCRLYYSNPVQNEAAGILVRSKISAIGQRLGFGELKREHMALVAAEMVSNQVKYARGQGMIQIWEQPGPVLDILALDYGPGIPDIALAQQDGYSTANTLGKGLGSIQRLADEMHVYTRPETPAGPRKWSGTAILARFSRGGPGPDGPGLYSRALSDERHNGDHIYFQSDAQGTRWLHLDGLGHGPEAEQATSGLGRYLDADGDPMAVVEAVDRQLFGTRGAVAILGRIAPAEARLQLLGVGDMHASVLRPGEPIQGYAFAPGVLGKEHKTPAPVDIALAPMSLVITATDGIRRNWDEDSFPGLFHQPPQLIAYVLGNIMGRLSDDQSVCVLRLPSRQ